MTQITKGLIDEARNQKKGFRPCPSDVNISLALTAPLGVRGLTQVEDQALIIGTDGQASLLCSVSIDTEGKGSLTIPIIITDPWFRKVFNGFVDWCRLHTAYGIGRNEAFADAVGKIVSTIINHTMDRVFPANIASPGNLVCNALTCYFYTDDLKRSLRDTYGLDYAGLDNIKAKHSETLSSGVMYTAMPDRQGSMYDGDGRRFSPSPSGNRVELFQDSTSPVMLKKFLKQALSSPGCQVYSHQPTGPYAVYLVQGNLGCISGCFTCTINPETSECRIYRSIGEPEHYSMYGPIEPLTLGAKTYRVGASRLKVCVKETDPQAAEEAPPKPVEAPLHANTVRKLPRKERDALR
jgi:hypothetical protein